MSEAVLSIVDSGADLATTDAGSAGESAQTDVTPTTGTSPEGAGTQDAGATQSESGTDNQSAPGGAAQGDNKEIKLVPIHALHESREQVKALKTQIAALEAQPKLSAEDLELLKDLKAQRAAAAKPAEPDFLQDPKAYIDAKANEAREEAKQTKEALKKLDEAKQAQEAFNQVVSGTSAKEAEFLKTTPDYYEAVTHMRTVRAAQLQMMLPNATPQQIQAHIGREEIQAAEQILRAGGDPADFAYRYAKTLGYLPKAPAAAAATTPAAAPKIDKDAARSLGGGGAADSTAEVGEDDGGDGIGALHQALAERFGVRKRK